MRVLAVTNLFPLPTDSGSAVRVLHVLRALSASFETTIIARSPGGDLGEERRSLEDATGATVEVFAGRLWTERNRLLRWISAPMRRRPTWISAQVVPALAHRIGEVATQYDRLVFVDDYSAAYLDVLRRRVGEFPPIVLDKHNVISRSLLAVAPVGFLGRVRQSFEVAMVRRFERDAVRRAQKVIVTSEDEAERFVAEFGGERPSVVRSGVELPEDQWSPGGALPSIVCAANFNYRPNLDGIMRFASEGWPAVDAEARLLLVGRTPQSVAALGALPNVDVTGFVEDLDGLLAKSSVGIAPLWSGAGVKLKTLTMMAAGLPVVGTSVALEGIDAIHGVHCLIADDPTKMAAEVDRLLSSPQMAARMGRCGRALIVEKYTWAALSEELIHVVAGAGAPAPVGRDLPRS